MSDNLGKKFEDVFKIQWKKTIPDSTIDRLIDVTLGYKSITNVSDFIGYKMPNIFYLELKTHKGSSIPFDKITQYEKLVKKVGIPGVRAGVVLFLYEKDKVLYIPASTIKQLKDQGEKSVGIRHLGKYNIKEIPSVKMRVFMDSDYSVLTQLQDGE